jgi:DNA-binding XRE family transcriptional regulator
MAQKWTEIRRTLAEADESLLQSRIAAELAKLPLAEVRKARKMTQNRLAELLHVNQGAVSKIEKRTDMYLSTLRSYVQAMGGNLEIKAVFPEGEILLENIGEISIESAPAAPSIVFIPSRSC